MTKTINELDTKKLKLIDLALTELATEIKDDKSSLLNKLICRYITLEDLEDFCDLHAGEYALKQHEASGREFVKLSDLLKN